MGLEIVKVPYGGSAESSIGKLVISVSEGDGEPGRNRKDSISVNTDGHSEMTELLKPGGNLHYGPTSRGKFEVRYVGRHADGSAEFRVCPITE